jgi:phospholipase D
MRLLICGLILWLMCSVTAGTFSSQDRYAVCFTPAQKCRRKITDYIYHAKHTVEVQAYSFTSAPIAYALINAQKRGVKVRVLVDKDELLNKSRLYLLLKHHIPVWLDSKVRIAHNKVMIIDRTAVLTGSYNFTNAAEYVNAENSLYLYAPRLAHLYYTNWQTRLAVSQPLNDKNVAAIQAHLQKQAAAPRY